MGSCPSWARVIFLSSVCQRTSSLHATQVAKRKHGGWSGPEPPQTSTAARGEPLAHRAVFGKCSPLKPLEIRHIIQITLFFFDHSPLRAQRCRKHVHFVNFRLSSFYHFRFPFKSLIGVCVRYFSLLTAFHQPKTVIEVRKLCYELA